MLKHVTTFVCIEYVHVKSSKYAIENAIMDIIYYQVLYKKQ